MAKGKAAPKYKLPEGFVPVRSTLDGFFIVEEGNSVQGLLRDSFEVDGQFGRKKVYKIEITAGTTRIMHKDDGETDASKGDVVGIDEKGWLRSLSDMEKGTEVYIVCTGREATAKKGQQPAWTFLVGAPPF